MTFEEKSVPLSVGEITCRVGGEGPSVLYLHSAGGFRQTAALEELARRFRIHAPIMPGFDGTPALEAVASMRDLARLADEFAAAVIGGECDVIGHSFGGWIAVWLAVQYPTRVGQLVLEAPAGFRVGGAGGLPTDPAALRKAMFAHPENLPTEQKSDEMVARNREMLGVYNQNTAFDEALAERLGEITALTLIVHGTEDGVIPQESPWLLKEKIPHAHLNYVYDAAHNIEVDQPENFAELVGDFLTRGEAFMVNAGSAAAE